MSRGIVNDLELVEVHEHQVTLFFAIRGALPCLLELRLECAAVEQVREFVVAGLVLELHRELHRLGHVLHLQHAVQETAVLGTYDREIRHNLQFLAIGPDASEFLVQTVELGIDEFAVVRLELIAIVLGDRVCELAINQCGPEHLLERRVGVEQLAIAVKQTHADRRVLEGIQEACFYLGPGLDFLGQTFMAELQFLACLFNRLRAFLDLCAQRRVEPFDIARSIDHERPERDEHGQENGKDEPWLLPEMRQNREAMSGEVAAPLPARITGPHHELVRAGWNARITDRTVGRG